jgi:non-specific serine/threonine protein kinase/serine/threonine-protein kinase
VEETAQWQKVKELFAAALERDPAQRDEFLREVCGPDNSLRTEIESLLSAHVRSDELSQLPLTTELLAEPQTPKSIGPYLLIKKIGEGGMGQVWLAEQTAPLHRQVALKLIRTGMYDDSTLRRFQAERQSLAIMDHPAIAKVFDAGATPDGRPYFVMEYVPGEPITAYCDRKKLKIRERLELFVKVCEGAQHAHQKAIIHRDLKPANILVVDPDGKPVPRIIDFGLAKADAPGAGETLFTGLGGFIGTPGYMSPEQTDPGVLDVDTRTDVYSLGVVLYELLTGLLPFDTREWKKKPLHEVLRHLREQDPLRPSTRVETERESSTTAADLRGTEPKQLANLLHGDLDWIAMKALEKDRARRYGTPLDLAADIGRYLNNEPVVARPASAGYRVQKYVRRHRFAVGVAAGLLILLAGFAVMQAVQLRRIARERDRAARERDRANRISDFMTGMFKVSDPSEARGNSVTAREILDKASNNINTGLASDPEIQAQMTAAMGKVYGNLGLYSRAQSLLQQTVDVRRRALGSDNSDTLKAQTELAWIFRLEGHYAQAETLLRQTLDAQKRVLGPDNPDTIKSTSNLAVVLSDEGHYPEAEAAFREVYDSRRRVLGPGNPDTIISMNNLATILFNQHRYADAEKLYREVLDIRRRSLGPEHPYTLLSMNNLAVILHSEGNYAEAEKLKRETLEIRQRVLGPEHPDTLLSMSNLADTLMKLQNYHEAETLLRQALEIQRRVLGPEHPQTLTSMTNLAEALRSEGDYAQAEKLLRQALEIQRRVLGPDHPETAHSTYSLACILAEEGKHDEALSTLRESVDHGLASWMALDIEKDPELKSLHGDPRFDALVAHAKERAAAAEKHN